REWGGGFLGSGTCKGDYSGGRDPVHSDARPMAAVRHDRALYDGALRRAREAAYAAGEYVGQESFMRASEIRELAERAGVGSGVSLLDLCCGVAGPGRFLT